MNDILEHIIDMPERKFNILYIMKHICIYYTIAFIYGMLLWSYGTPLSICLPVFIISPLIAYFIRNLGISIIFAIVFGGIGFCIGLAFTIRDIFKRHFK